MRLIQVFCKWMQLCEVPILLTEVSSWFKSFCPVFMTPLPATSPKYSLLSISSKTTGCSFKSPTISKTLISKTMHLAKKLQTSSHMYNIKHKIKAAPYSMELILPRLVYLRALTEPKVIMLCSPERYTASYQSYGNYFGQQLIKYDIFTYLLHWAESFVI